MNISRNNLIIILLVLTFSNISFAATPDLSIDPFILGPKIISFFTTNIVDKFNPIYNIIFNNSMSYVGNVFKLLFMLDIAYVLSKCYLEGNYNGIATTFVTKAFFGSCAFAFVVNPNFFYGIPSDVANAAFSNSGAGNVNFANTTPMTTLANVVKELFTPWDNALRSVLTSANDAKKAAEADTSWSLSGLLTQVQALLTFYIAIVIGFVGYIILLLASFGLVLKGVEFSIALPIAVFFLAFKATGITNSYAENGLKYIITATFEFMLLVAIAKLGNSLVNNNASPTGVFDLLARLFPLFMYVTIIKIAPSIGSGILSGSPSVKMSDAGRFLETAMLAKAMATAMPFMAAGGVGAITGALKGAGTSMASGEGIMATIKGGAQGAKGGIQRSNERLGGGGGGAMSSLSSSLSNAIGGR